MASPLSSKWTLTSLIGSYLNLAITCLLLVGSSLSFLASEFLSLFNLTLPCPCSGFFASNPECIHSRIELVQGDILTRLPFDVMLSGCRPVTKVEELGSNFDDGGSSIEGEATPRSEYYSASDSLSSVRDTHTSNDNLEIIENLEHELEEAQAAHASLYLELEEERSAAATAAEETMAMILRLQNEKAAVEMESRQYQRLIEEKSAYDREEMEILKEIIIMREKEKHFLVKEVEAYRRDISGEMTFTDECNAEAEENGIVEKEICKEHSSAKKLDEYDEVVSSIHDVHVIDDKHGIKSASFVSKSECEVDALDIKTPVAMFKRSYSENGRGANSSDTVSDRGSSCHVRRSSMSAIDGEIFKLETEVESLRKRLKCIRKNRESLNFSKEYKEKESFQLKLFEEIARQLQEIRKLTGTGKSTHQASLPPLACKLLNSTAKPETQKDLKASPMKRWRTVAFGLHESA